MYLPGSYVINMLSRPDRMKEFRSWNEQAMRFNAVVPDQVPDGYNLPVGMLGCTMSHSALWNKIAEDRDGYYMIFEDDAVPARSDWQQITARIFSDTFLMFPDFDILYLGGNHTHHGAQPGEIVLSSEKYSLHKCNRTYTTHAYIISSGGARKMTGRYAHLLDSEAVDVAMCTLQQEGSSFYAAPSVFAQRASFSDIWQCNVDYSNCIK